MLPNLLEGSLQQGNCLGFLDVIENKFHIYAKEMLAIMYTLKSFLQYIKNRHVSVLLDHTTAVGTVNKMGSSKSSLCDEICHKIWEFCHKNNIYNNNNKT